MIVNLLDLETTGLKNPKTRIIELSMRLLDTDTMLQTNEYLFRFLPDKNIEARAFAVHGISMEDLKDEPKFVDMVPTVKPLIENADILIGHNIEYFDWPMIQQEFEVNGLNITDMPLFDTMLEGTFATDLGKRPTLKELCWALDVEYNEKLAHKGDYDTLVMMQAFVNGVKFGWFEL